jgi:hypothetical protein
MTSSTITAQPSVAREAVAVPWGTVVPLAVALAFVDGFWTLSLRGAVGAIERMQEPAASWFRESTLLVPAYVVAVLGALTWGLRRYGPVLRSRRQVAATGLLVVAATTLLGIVVLVVNAAYDYGLQARQLAAMAVHTACASGDCVALGERASLLLQVRAVAWGSAILLVSHLLVVAGAAAVRGGRLSVAVAREHRASPVGASSGSRVGDLRLLLVAGLVGSAALHAAVVPEHLAEWRAAGLFFVVLTVAQLGVAGLLLARLRPLLLLTAALVSAVPLGLWLYSRSVGLPFGPEPGVPEAVGLVDVAATVLGVLTLVLAVELLRSRQWLRTKPAGAPHVQWLGLLAVLAVTAIGFAGLGVPTGHDGESPDEPSVSAAALR